MHHRVAMSIEISRLRPPDPGLRPPAPEFEPDNSRCLCACHVCILIYWNHVSESILIQIHFRSRFPDTKGCQPEESADPCWVPEVGSRHYTTTKTLSAQCLWAEAAFGSPLAASVCTGPSPPGSADPP